MNVRPENPDVIREYLLGRLSQEQHLTLEERLLTSDDLFEEIEVAEDELIDEYLRGELSEAEQTYFATRFLQSPERQQKLRFARTFNRYVDSAGAEGRVETAGDDSRDFSAGSVLRRLLRARNPVLSLSLAAALALLLLGIPWVLIKRAAPPQAAHGLLAVSLKPRLVRDAGETNRIVIPAEVSTVRLRLALPLDDYKTYRATLRSSDGAEVWAEDNLTVNTDGVDRYVEYDLPAKFLKPDDYKVTLSGRLTEDKYEDITHYPFRVVR